MNFGAEFQAASRPPSIEFERLQRFLRTKGSIDLGWLERELERELVKLFSSKSDSNGTDFTDQDKTGLARRLLLWYCLGWAVANTEEIPWESSRMLRSSATSAMEEHRRRLSAYASQFRFPQPYRDALESPENMSAQARVELEDLVLELRIPKGEICFPSQFFQKGLRSQIDRYFEPLAPASVVELWGKDNFSEMLASSPRTHFLINRLVWKAKLGTSKIANLEIHF
jgi:hypothetical protein